MPNRRYHIHVICAANDQQLLLEEIAVFLQSRAFLTYDVSSQLPKATLYSRQCIDACDYTMVIVGDSYGMTHKTGVSQMHLSYLSAKAKLKPMLVLIKTQSDNFEISRQLQDFMRLVEQQANRVYYYDNDTNIEQLLTYAYDSMEDKYPSMGWVQAEQSSYPTASKPIITPRYPTSSAYSSIISKGVGDEPEPPSSVDTVTESIALDEQVNIEYTAQAYEGGNLTDVTMTLRVTWCDILAALVKIPAAFSRYGLQNCINSLITPRAETNIKRLMPKVHAVSRCQILSDDLVKLQRSMVKANWIELMPSGSRTSKELWKLTFYAKKQFKDSQEYDESASNKPAAS